MFKKLTYSQKKKADRVIKMLEDLSSQGITFYMNSTPNLQIGFLNNAHVNMDYDEWMAFINTKDGEKYYSPSNNIVKESYGY